MSLIISIFNKIVTLFLENSNFIFNFCILGAIILLINDQVEECDKKRKRRAR